MTDTRLNLLLLAALVAALVIACLLGSTALPPGRLLAALAGGGDSGDSVVLWSIRLPRALAAVTVGFALGVSGAALQGLLRNPLAEPGVLGVSATSALAATLTLYYGLADHFDQALPLAAIIGALAATALLAGAATRIGSVTTLILIGVGLSSLAGAVMALLLSLAPNPFSLADMVNWMMGSVATRSLPDLAISGPFVLAGAAILFLSRRGLAALTLGEEAAAGIGLNVARQRMLVVFGTGLATGGAVAIAGAIGFVGIVAPHLVRPLTGYDPARSLLPAGLLGGVLLVAADICARLLPTDAELKLGVVAALIGAPIFIWIAAARRSGS